MHLYQKIQNNIQAFVARWTLDGFESDFIKHASNFKVAPHVYLEEKFRPNILVQMPADYFYLCLFFTALRKLNGFYEHSIGLWHQNIMSSPRGNILHKLFYFVRKIFNTLDRLKWQRLYKAIGLKKFETLEIGYIGFTPYRKEADEIWRSLKTKRDLLELVVNGTHCGDLIYDTYLRYRIQPTVDLQDVYLRFLIEKAFQTQFKIREIFEKDNIKIFLTSYSSYIQHGIPVREASRAGIEIFTSGNLSQYFKKLTNGDCLHAASHWKYGELFSNLPKLVQEEALLRSSMELEARFKGGVDRATLYMKESAYTQNKLKFPMGIEGVVFLHDFFDSPHCYRNMLFEDFWEWANFTIKKIADNNLKIAIKPHPNQLPESAIVVKSLMEMYPQVIWIDPRTSNAQIFSSGIKVGISVYGTILHELAYHGICPIAAGDHPHIDFNIANTPISIVEYENLLINYRNLSIRADTKDEVLRFYYMHNIYSKEDLMSKANNFDYRIINQNISKGLKEYLKFENS